MPEEPKSDYGFNVTFSYPDEVELPEPGFNRYGVKEYDDGSIDVIFKAMEPGTRRGVEVTSEFLQKVAQNTGEKAPVQMDHNMSQHANVGWMKDIKFSNNFLKVMFHVPNTGSEVRNDVISDFTHDPPAIQDGSVGLDPNEVEVERTDDGPVFTDGKLREFSLTPFPGGYDNGGISPKFSEYIGETTEDNAETGSKQYLNSSRSYLKTK